MGTKIRETLLRVGLRYIRGRDRRVADLSKLNTPHIRRILVVSSTAIGDTLLSTPGIRSLREAYPEAHIALLLNEAYVGLFSNNPHINAIIPYAGGYRRFFRLAWALRQERFDVVAIFHGNEPQITPLAYLSGAPFRFKLPNNNDFRFLLTNTDPIKSWDDFPHGIDQRLAVATLAGGRSSDRRMVLPIEARARERLWARREKMGISPTARLIAFQPGASTVSRRWAPSRFIALGQALLARFPEVHLVLTGSPKEEALTQQIAKALPRDRVWDTAGRIPLEELPALIASSAVFVTGDTGPMHMALAVGTPVVALFAPSDWRRSGPTYDLHKHTVIQKWITCDPCLSKRCPYPEPLCMANIEVDEVEQAVLARLAATEPVPQNIDGGAL